MKDTSTRFAIAVLTMLFALTLRGDTVELKTGEHLDGAFRQASAAGVVIEIAGQAMTIPLGKVQAIYFGAQRPASVSTAPAPFAEALDALRALRSVTESGVTFRDYATRVLDARVKVDRCQNSSAAATVAARLAMREYELASRAWSAGFATEFDDAPATVPLLDVRECERRDLGSAETATEQDSQDRAIAQPFNSRNIRRAEKGLRLS